MRHASSLERVFRTLTCLSSTKRQRWSLYPNIRTLNIRNISRFRYHAELPSAATEGSWTAQEQRNVQQLKAGVNHLVQFQDKIARCENILHYLFKDKYRCVEALNDRKYLPNDGRSGVIYNNNNRLAILGDTLLDKYLCERWFKAGGSRVARASYGMVRSALATNESLSSLGRRIGLEDCIIVEHQGAHLLGDITIATAVEALIAAVYLDGGDEALASVMDCFKFDHPLLRPWSEQSLVAWRREEKKKLETRKADRAKMQLSDRRRRIDTEKDKIEASLGWKRSK